jgi:aerobic-type carbon monoxide dehydrogenase small subunit (CoxS/CutS family)
MSVSIEVNGRLHATGADLETPLIYVLSGDLRLKGPRFGCGLGQCGSCSVLLDGREIRSCITSLGDVVGRAVTTLEGLPALYAKQQRLSEAPTLHPLQEAMIAEQAPQCGYCYNGMLVKAVELLNEVMSPSEEQIRDHMSGHLCRCGTYQGVINSINRAAAEIAERKK